MNHNQGQPFPQQARVLGRPPVQHGRRHETQSRQPVVSYTEHEWAQIQTKLSKALGPEYVSSRPGGGGAKINYIEGWKALNLANEIFGFNGWSSEMISCEIDYLDAHNGRFSLGLSIVVRITIKDGTYHEDIGYGFVDNSKSKAMAFEKCKKEAFTDGIKRCLRCFGNVLGNCLYDKTIVKHIDKVKEPPIEYEAKNFHRDPLLVERARKKEYIERKLVEEEQRKQQQQQEQQKRAENGVAGAGAGAGARPNRIEPVAVSLKPHMAPPDVFITPKSPRRLQENFEGKDADEMDESFLFSDDPGEEDSQTSHDNQQQPQQPQQPQPPPPPPPQQQQQKDPSASEEAMDVDEGVPPVEQPVTAFVTAKSAPLLQSRQQDSTAEMKRFDTTFVSPNVRRTVDPTKSVPVKRTDARAINSPNGINHLHNRINKPSINPLHNNLGKRVGMPPPKINKRLHTDRDNSPNP
ncbi:uncharacterized protein LODBEIA_P43340 [Lodderomyces beijingensis]|uniref:DNA repair and recombination protein RAD52 n=1 Tax=Lodderomyces beijingensis TaxID=1775926 RepID=A0ABP0ZV50_9ASCO